MRPPYTHRLTSAAFAGALLMLATAALAAASYRVSQRDRAFNRTELTVAVGDVVHFDNNDEFIHQIYIESPDFAFDSAESYPGNTIDVAFTKPGVFFVHCHIHPKMSLHVTVK